MLFNSLIFILFSIAFFSGWYFIKKYNTAKWVYLTAFSFVFYGWWDWRFLFLIIFSGLVDYIAGLAMKMYPNQKKLALITSLIMNLGSLSIFKYSTFFAKTIEDLAQLFNVSISLEDKIPEFALILPVGISFYTFQSMSYTIDIYRGRIISVKNIFHFFAYLSMFPQLVAGPIIRAKDMLKQLAQDRQISAIAIWNGLKLITIGFFQKWFLQTTLDRWLIIHLKG